MRLSPRQAVPLAGATIAILVVVLVFANAKAFSAAETFRDSSQASNWSERIELAASSFDEMPSLATKPRQLFFEQAAASYAGLAPLDRARLREVLEREEQRGLSQEPQSHALLNSVVLLRQVSASTPEDLDAIDPLLERLQEVGPEVFRTHRRLAFQALLRGRPEEALKVIDDYTAKAPGTQSLFGDLKNAAEQLLRQQAP